MAIVTLTPPPTTQVLIKELCPKCRGTGQVEGINATHRIPCSACEGSGMGRRWVNLIDLVDLIAAERRRHAPTGQPCLRQQHGSQPD